MWGTSSSDDEFTGDFGNAIEATQIADRRLVRPVAGNLSPGNFGLLQQNLPGADICTAAKAKPIRSPRQRDRTKNPGVRGRGFLGPARIDLPRVKLLSLGVKYKGLDRLKRAILVQQCRPTQRPAR